MLNQLRSGIRIIFITVAALICLLRLEAQTFNIIKEMNSTSTLGSINNTTIATIGNKVLFFSDDGINGLELWSSDGTAAGTERLTDVLPGAFAGVSLSAQSAIGDGVFYFAASDASELWRSDGTQAGTYPLKSFGGANRVSQMFWHHNFLLFVASDGVNGFEPWISDGTQAGTVMLKNINAGSASSLSTAVSPYNFVALGSEVFFAASTSTTGRELWKTDGTSAGTVIVKDLFPGTQNGVNNMKAAPFGGKLIFAGTNGATGTELWSTDGTDAGTLLLKDIAPGSGNAYPNNLINFNGALYFSASNANISTPGLWMTDGTTSGTQLVRDMAADGVALAIGFTGTTNFFAVNSGKLYFRAFLVSGSCIFISDGTSTGTTLLKEVRGNGDFVPFNGELYFQGAGSESNNSLVLYKTDGTANGTIPVAQNALDFSLPFSNYPAVLGGKLFFAANDLASGIELWSTDGTGIGTTLVKDINESKSGTPTSSQSIKGAIEKDGHFYFTAGDANTGIELWKTDGTSAGTMMVKDINQGKPSSIPSQFCLAGGQIFFTANDGVHGYELWKTDGTESGTVMVKDINPGYTDGATGRLIASGPLVYFLASHPDYGTELWQSDGTEAGTFIASDQAAGPASGFANTNTQINYQNKAYIINSTTLKLAVMDGSSGGTYMDGPPDIVAAYDMEVIGNTLYIGGRNSAGFVCLWRIDNGGSAVLFKVIRNSDGGTSGLYQFKECNGKLYFSANDGSTGNEPWVSDGTEAGTFRLKDIQAGPAGSLPFHFTASGNKVFFQARTAGADAELWATDGTEAGTYLVKDINPGGGASNPGGFIAIPGSKVLFTANDGVNGIELWQSDGTATGTLLLRDFNSSGNGMLGMPSNFHFKENFLIRPFNDGMLLFANTAERGNQLYFGSFGPRELYVNDNSTVGDHYTTAIGNDDNAGMASAPFATLTKALSVATDGARIYVDAGTYAEQVIITKGINITGAGRDLTFFNVPATPLVPAPGSFTEIGLFESIEGIGEVHISAMTINSAADANAHTIVLQTGGSVAQSNIDGNNVGIFFRVSSANATAFIQGNTIGNGGIGTNCQGANLVATIANNHFYKTGFGFYSAVFAGLDFGPIPQLNVSNNIFENYFGDAMLVASFDGQIHDNSFLGRANSKAIHRYNNNGNALNASCNWFGVNDGNAIGTQLTGILNFSPWLTNGTDNDVAIGFQPVPNSCNGATLMVTVANKSDATCGNNNGAITINVVAGIAPYQIIWSQPGNPVFTASGASISGLTAGEYFAEVADAVGNTGNIYVSVADIASPTGTATGTALNCFGGNNGTASVNVEGGAPPYSYLWSNGATTDMISNLTAGVYTVAITDANGCTATAQYEVTQPALLVATATGTSTSCVNSATVSSTGGSGSYTYLWSNGATTQSITSIPAGTYSVTVTDANGCTSSASATVSGNQAFNPSVATTDVSCFGGSDGTLTVTNANGVAPFTYSLNGISFQSSNVFSGLPAGNYTVTVKDALGCTGFNTKEVGQPSAIVVTLNSVQSSCFGANSGSINTTASGGSPGFNYSWSGPGGYTANSSNISNLAGGSYTLTVTDSKGCTASLQVNVPTLPQIVLSSSVTPIACKGDLSGAINNTLSGGSGAGFSYLWNGGATTEDRTNLAPGNYGFTATDLGNGCSVTASFTITQPATAVNLSVSKSNAQDCNLGTITVTGSGGTGPYEYRLNAGAYQTSGVFANVAAGTYTVWVKDANGCTKTAGTSITDNGSDAYEGNNSKNQGKPIAVGTAINARIGSATDIDWFSFTTPAGTATYQLMVSHPGNTLTFSLDTSGKNAPAPTAVSSTPTSKTYNLKGGTLYYVQVSGTASAVCYTLLVTQVVAAPITSTTDSGSPKLAGSQDGKSLSASAYPNPHRGSLTFAIESPVSGKGSITLYDLLGRRVGTRHVDLVNGKNTITWQGLPKESLLYEVIVGNERRTGKILSID